ncbi:hypothetical protein TWF225_004607 [Orbilia oligospora]|nr:hypothetical protein TWF225_004607 [Orbilia oligospora]
MAAAYARELVTLIPTEEAARELEVLGERVISTPKSLVSRSEASKTTRPSSTTANPASSSSDITSTITGSKFNGPTYLFVGTTGSNITVSSSATPETTASNPEVSNKPNCKRRRGWVEDEDEDEEDDGYSSDDEEDKYIAIIAGALELWRLIVNVAIDVTTVVRKVTGRGIKSADWGLNVVNLVVGQDVGAPSSVSCYQYTTPC